MSSAKGNAMRVTCVAIGLMASLLSGCGADSYGPVEILYADGGGIDKSADGRMRLMDSEVVPLQVGQRYGWRMYLRTNRSQIRVKEEITMAGPTTWGGSSELKVSADGRSATKMREVDGTIGFIGGVWGVNGDDPAGVVEIKVTIEDKAEQRFKFVLKKP